MTKQDKLIELDNKILDLMLKWTNDEDTEKLTELSVAVNYLKSNSIVEEKKKSSVEDDTKKRIAKAKKRRANNEV